MTGVLTLLRSREERLLRLRLRLRGLEDDAAADDEAPVDDDPDEDNDDNNDVLRVLLSFEDEEDDIDETADNSAFLRWLRLRIRVIDAEVRIVESNSEDKAAASLAFPPVPATAGNEAVFLVYSAIKANKCSFSSSVYVRDGAGVVGGWCDAATWRAVAVMVCSCFRSFRFVLMSSIAQSKQNNQSRKTKKKAWCY